MSYMEAIGRQAKEAEKKVRILGQTEKNEDFVRQRKCCVPGADLFWRKMKKMLPWQKSGG